MIARNVEALEHVGTPSRLVFPSEATVPETKRHLELRTILYQLLKGAVRDRACTGSDQFVYWNAADPRRCLAPDAFVRFGSPEEDFDSWKTWERGAPQLAVEVASDSDARGDEWARKLEKYRELGVLELVRFDPDRSAGARLGVWDRIDGDLVERVVVDDRTPATLLGLTWAVSPADDQRLALRLARDPAGHDLLPTLAEARELEAKAREVEAQARASAEQRIAELEAELRRRGG